VASPNRCTHISPRPTTTGPILATLALAGALVRRRTTPAGLGTLRTDTPTFVIGFVVVFALLNFLAARCLGPLDQSLTQHLY
jgi:K+-transporting ATPase ATPase A chain